PKNQECTSGMKTLHYGSMCFLPRTSVTVPAKAYLNRWATHWFRRWFYYQVPSDCPLRLTCQPIRYVRCPVIKDSGTLSTRVSLVAKIAKEAMMWDLAEEYIAAGIA